MRLPKIPIDYSKAGSGEEPFASTLKILHIQGVFTDYQAIGTWRNGKFQTGGTALQGEIATHYTPMPEFYEEGGE